MKLVPLGLKSWTLATALTLTHTITIAPALGNTAIRLDNNIDSIEIYVPPPEQNTPGICSANLSPIIEEIVERPSLNRGKWAILVQSLNGTTIYSRHPDSYMIPASNIKLLVTAAALQKLDPSGQIRSTSISNWIKITNLKSNNDYANILLRYLGGSQSVQQALTSLGVDSKGYRLRDGSGLSRNNLATPRTLVSTLKAMYNAKNNDIFLASLPVAGISGTLKGRLHHTTTQGTVRAKTGTLRGVSALSGYIEHPDYDTVVFSIIANQPQNQSKSAIVAAIDEIVLRLSTLTYCQ
ncbi:MAG: hypothetical protein Tsb0014_47560 [Pleurocapsa sp.]